MVEIKKETIKAYALENAIKHNGKANQEAILNALFTEGLKKNEIPTVIPTILEVMEELDSLSLEQQKKEFEKLKDRIKKREQREGLPLLKNAEKNKVVMRIAPYPSGPLHIGNARQLILNDEYSKMYNGKLILVIDDTIGSIEKPINPDAYELIPEGINWLNVNYDKRIIYKSDRLEKYYAYAKELIKKGYMYVCSCPQEDFQKLRKDGRECSCRNLPEEANLGRWEKMFNSGTRQGEYVVRLKTDMQHPNPSFRDRVMFRISERSHPRLKNKYKVWPLLEFSWAIDDHLLEITHIIRGIELMMETKVEEFIWDIFKWKKPLTIHTGLFAIQGIKLSKSKGAKEVKSGEYIGWNDPRTFSLQSLRDRGFSPQSIREFILNMGLTKANSTIAIDVLYTLNRKFVEKSPRYFFIPKPVKIHISGAPELEAIIPLHPDKSLKLGFKKCKTSQDFFIPKKDFDLIHNNNYRLMHLLNFKAVKMSLTQPSSFHFISEEPEGKLGVKFIQWLSYDEKEKNKNVEIIVRMPDNSVVNGLGEPALSKLKKGDVVQFERFGFVSLYKKLGDNKLEFWFAHR